MIRVYHFVGDRLRDGRPVPPNGEWLVHDGELAMCESGLHASRHPFDALTYAPGPVLCLVDCDEIGAEDGDKLVCRRRRIVARFDATDMLRLFARQCALDVIHLWDAPQVVRDYLTTGDDSIRAAAWYAARAVGAAMDPARAAAMETAWAAAWAAERDAARAVGAAWAAAWASAMAAAAMAAAAWAAAGDAARDAARDAAGDAAGDAARDDQRTRFAGMVDAEFARMGVV